MKLILLITFISLSCMANSILIYDANEQQKNHLISTYQAQELFTATEKKSLKQLGSNLNILKLETKKINEQVKEFLNSEKIKYEDNITQKFFNIDPFENLQWGLNNTGELQREWTSDINATYTQGVIGEDIASNSIIETDKKIKVAIIDSGVDLTHPDLVNQIIHNTQECKDLETYNTCMRENPDRKFCKENYAGLDHNQNGYPLDCNGWNIGGNSLVDDIDGSPFIKDLVGHGTHVAGIIGAQRNGEGVSGVIQNVELVPVQVGTSSTDYGENEVATDIIAKGLLYAIKSNVDVINLSLGWNIAQDSTLMREMIEMAIKKGIFVVAAAGNDSHTAPVYPCSYPNVICVAAHDVTGKIADFSNKGFHIDLLAPGKNILSTWPTNLRSKRFTQDDNYEYMTGTSQAAPFVSGAIALLLNQGVPKEELKSRLFKSSRKNLNKSLVQFGNLDVEKVLSEPFTSLIIPAQKSSFLTKWEEDENGNYSFLLKLKNIGKISSAQEMQIKAVNQDVLIQNKKISIQALSQNEEFEYRVFFKSPRDINSLLNFELTFKNSHDLKIQTKSLNLISPEDKRAIDIKSDLDLSSYLIKSVDNVFDKRKDFIGLQKVGRRTHVVLLKEGSDQYSTSQIQKLPVGKAFFLKLSKVDLDIDGSPEYVIALVEIKSAQEKITKFFVFDQDFIPKRYDILPKNTFDNDLTAMPGNFYWIKQNGKFIPMWIGMGIRQESEREPSTPWHTPVEKRSSHLYYFDSVKGLKTIVFPSNDTFPIHALFQSNSSRMNGQLYFITSTSFNFYKKYQLYKFNEKLEFIREIDLNPYINLTRSTPFAMSNTLEDNAFFSAASSNGSMRVVSIKASDKVVDINYKLINSPNEIIERILSFDGDNYIAQSNYSFINSTSKVDSVINSNIIKHDILYSSMSLFLKSTLTFNLGSDFVSINAQGDLYKPADKTYLGVQGCSEADIFKNSESDILTYLCPQDLKLINIKI